MPISPIYQGWATDVDKRLFEVSTNNTSLVVGAIQSIICHLNGREYKIYYRDMQLLHTVDCLKKNQFKVSYNIENGLIFLYDFAGNFTCINKLS